MSQTSQRMGSFSQSLHSFYHWQVVGKISQLGTINIVNAKYMSCAFLLLQGNLSPGEKTADLAFSKKKNQYDFDTLAWRQPCRLTQKHNQ